MLGTIVGDIIDSAHEKSKHRAKAFRRCCETRALPASHDAMEG